MFSPLIKFCGALEPLSNRITELVYEDAKILDLQKGTQLYPDGVASKHLIFIAKGLLRKYSAEGNRQITLSIYGENELIGYSETDAYLPNENLECLSNARLILLSKELVERLYRECPEANGIARKVLAMKYDKSVEESRLARLPSALKRYSFFKASNAGRRLPAKILSSYLCMREETFCRIKKNESLDN